MKDLMKYLAMAAWLVVGLVALDFGLAAFNQSFLMSNGFIMQNMVIVQYVVLAAAVWTLYLFVMACQGHCGCGKKGCK